MDLTGHWTGSYDYPGGREPGAFVATLIGHGAGFSGLTMEVSRDGQGRRVQPSASVSGAVAEGVATFTKTYDGSAGWVHAVICEGAVTDDGHRIEGTWLVPGNWSGRFRMTRPRRATTAATRVAEAVI